MILTIDIEVEVTDGFHIQKMLNDKITAITVHDSGEDEYYCFVLDDKKKLTYNQKIM